MSIKYQMWLTYNAEKEKIQLPVLPESFSTKNGSSNDTMDIAGLGEIVIMQSRPALQFSFSSFFPAAKFPGRLHWCRKSTSGKRARNPSTL